MAGASRSIPRAFVAAFACVLALPAAALGKTSSATLTIPSTGKASCAARHSAGTRGVLLRNYTASADSVVTFRLSGSTRSDWDLGVFDTADGRRVGASQAWRSNEVVQAVMRRGDGLMVEACRMSGAASTARLSVEEYPVTLAAQEAAAFKEKLVAIPLSDAGDFTKLESLGLNLDEVPNDGKAIAVLESAGDASKITGAGFTYKTLDDDVMATERKYRAREEATAAQAEPSALPSGRNEYRTLEDIQADLKAIVDKHPNLARAITLPKKSYQGRDVTGIEITENPNAVDDGKPIFFLMGVHHAREWPAGEIPVEFGIYLTEGFGKDDRITNLLKKVRITIVPIVNPDGYVASRGAVDPADNSGDPQALLSLGESVAPPGGNLAYRRKNCHGFDQNPSTPCELTHGVDPNRNYGQYWGGPGAGTDPNSQTYRGTDQWSETETQNIHEYSQTHDVTSLITMHNFASLVLRPPGLHTQGLAPDEDAMKELGDKMGDATGYISQFGYQLYDTTGTTEDWNYAAAGTFGYTIEMGPSSDKGGNFHIEFARAVVNQWTGEETELGKGKGLREALLLAGETAANTDQFPTLKGTAPPDSVLRLHKDFDTPTSDPICAFETTDVDCPGGFEPGHVAKDFLDYTTVVPPSGKYSWIVTPSTRPFELKAGKTEQWTFTCENPQTHKVEETRQVTIDRGQTLPVDFTCGAKPGVVTPQRGCVDKRKLTLRAHKPGRQRLVRIDVYVNDKRFKRLKGSKASSGVIKLRKLRPKRGRYKVTVVVYGNKGYRRVTTRVYRGCKKGRARTNSDRGRRGGK